MLILRLIVRFELSKKQSLVFTAEYLQGMHEIVAFILYTFVNQFQHLSISELNKMQGCISARLEDVLADTYIFSSHIITRLLPVYLNHYGLQSMCDAIILNIKSLDQEFYNQIKNDSNLPPFVTFVQRSIKLLFIRDFVYEKVIFVWDAILAVSFQHQDHWFSFIGYLLAQLYYWRYLNMQSLGLETIFDVFLEQGYMFPKQYDC